MLFSLANVQCFIWWTHVWLILIRKCVVFLIVDAFWLTFIRKCVVDACLAYFHQECVRNQQWTHVWPIFIRKVNQEVEPHFIRIGIFACFLVSLIQSIVEYHPTVDFIVQEAHGHPGTLYGHDRTAAPTFTALLLHFWLFFQYSLDLITQIIVNCLPGVINISDAPQEHTIAEPRIGTTALTCVTMIFRVFGLISVFPYKSCSIPRQRALTHRLYDQARLFTQMWKAPYRQHRY